MSPLAGLFMDEFDLCRIADTFSLAGVAALICGIRPSRVQGPDEYGQRTCHIPHQASFTEFETGEEVQDDTPKSSGPFYRR